MKELFEEGKNYLDSEIEEILAFCKQTVEEFPEDFKGYVGMAHCYVRLKQFDLAAKNAEKALELNPESAEAYHVLTYVAFLRRKQDNALFYAQKAYELDRDSYTSLLNYGFANYKIGNYSQALEFYEKAFVLRPDDLVGRRALVINYIQSGRWEEARSEAKALWEINPSILALILRLFSFLKIRYRIMENLFIVVIVSIVILPVFGGIEYKTPLLIGFAETIVLIFTVRVFRAGSRREKIGVTWSFIVYTFLLLLGW